VTNETCASGDWRQAYANYLVEYIKLYKQEGITIDFIGFLNEPEFKSVSSTLVWDPLHNLTRMITTVPVTTVCSLIEPRPHLLFLFSMTRFTALDSPPV
jgi:O-glycosyl hydrolase